MNTERPIVSAALILGVALVLAALVGGIFISKVRATNDTLSSTGSAKVRVESDSGKLSGSIIRYATESTLQQGYRAIAADAEKVRTFLGELGVTSDEITITPVSLNEQYQYGEGAVNQPKRYELRQTVTIDSKDLAKLTKLGETIDQLVYQDVLFQSYGVQYFYSGLADARVELLGEAIQDAEARVEQMARAAGSRVGKLVSASSGVVQVLNPNSVDISDYGMYDTTTIEKDISVTVRATFRVK